MSSGGQFSLSPGGCEDCSARAGCLRSSRPLASKHVELSVPAEVADELRGRLALVRGKSDEMPTRVIAPISAPPGPLDIGDPLFLPARARDRFRSIFRRATLHVVVELPPPARPRPMLVAADLADRQRRRKTWEQDVARCAMYESASAWLTVAGAPEVRHLLGEAEAARVAVGGSRWWSRIEWVIPTSTRGGTLNGASSTRRCGPFVEPGSRLPQSRSTT